MSVTRERLHELVECLPEAKAGEALRVLEPLLKETNGRQFFMERKVSEGPAYAYSGQGKTILLVPKEESPDVQEIYAGLAGYSYTPEVVSFLERNHDACRKMQLLREMINSLWGEEKEIKLCVMADYSDGGEFLAAIFSSNKDASEESKLLIALNHSGLTEYVLVLPGDRY